jgi:hypothetical protein
MDLFNVSNHFLKNNYEKSIEFAQGKKMYSLEHVEAFKTGIGHHHQSQ